MKYAHISKLCSGTSLVLVFFAIGLLIYPGPRLSIDFTGGTLLELRLPEDKTKDDLSRTLYSDPLVQIASANISTTKAKTFLVRTRDLSQEEHVNLLNNLQEELGTVEELQFTTIGPIVGANLKKRAAWALAAASVAIILYLAFAFRKVPRRLNPWMFGVCALAGIAHDVLVTIGIFTILSFLTSFELDMLFITAILSIMGYSVNDTIVIFDRIRDTLFTAQKSEDFSTTAEQSLRQSIHRTVNTSTSTLIMLLALFFLGSESIRWFILALIIGIILGTYSSFFVATPLLVFFQKHQRQKGR
ncbi:protein translocase subunit SecF [Candidatus Peregrinibacteria bacterium CG10_big_fil_rev_8_21_14_0_10_49_16]|nr:MAG: protein translocase subunit SecF [Candidatus Peregrinibacteria bacterium CG22_combo_CG10-13_8_21_14_all_49_11]PIR52007.1 MAG: protein translocase subunit SecF [Candidatus Peregrinibacteria bacterium CG10_big_fil_rev_8_21_14_0_10_49_16]